MYHENSELTEIFQFEVKPKWGEMGPKTKLIIMISILTCLSGSIFLCFQFRWQAVFDYIFLHMLIGASDSNLIISLNTGLHHIVMDTHVFLKVATANWGIVAAVVVIS